MSDSVMRNDIFSNLRKFSGTSLCVFLTCFTIYTIVAGQFAAQVQRGIFLLCSGVAVYCFNPFNPRWEKGDNLFPGRIKFDDLKSQADGDHQKDRRELSTQRQASSNREFFELPQ